MKNKICTFLSLLLFASLPTSALADFDDLVIFGDSLSDTGNLASLPGVPEFPFFFYEQSRVSNGPVAVEGLAEKLGLSADASLHLDVTTGIEGSNFAVAGANAAGFDIINLETQVNSYLAHKNGIASPNSLFVMFIGGNDVRDAYAEDKPIARQMIKDAVESIDRELRRLISAGAEKILVVNSPNIGAIPETHKRAAETNSPELIREATALTKRFNRKLARRVHKIEQQTGLDLVLFDLFAYLGKILDNSVAKGYANTSDACFDGENGSFHPDCQLDANFEASIGKFLFFDLIHPTKRSHERVSRAFYSEVPEAPTP